MLKSINIKYKEKIAYLASYDLNPISLLFKIYLNEDYFNITFNFIDELSHSMKKTHFANLKEIKESQVKIILYKKVDRLQ